jgi:ABC-type multidrug transport system fused ATPase/permease subunit
MPFSHCPAESKKQFYYGGALLCVVIDLFLLVTYFVFRCRRLQREKRRTRHEVRRVSGRRHGTITEASYSKKMANFVTLSDHVDDRSDSDSSLPHLKSTIFSRRFWKKRVDRLINGIWTYMPLSWQQAHPGKAHSVEPQSHIINLHGDHLRGSTNSYTSVAQHTLALGLSVPKWTPSDSDSDTIVENLEMDDHPQSLESDSGNRHASLNLNKLVLGFRKAQNNQDLALRFRFQDLSLVLPSGKAILSGVTGSIDPGRVTVIMGPSGAGKSTFMNVLMGKATRTGGRLMINDREVEMYRFKKVGLFKYSSLPIFYSFP